MGVKRYFQNEFQWSMFGLEDDNAAHFYVSSFQKNRSAVPLMLIRFIVFLGCLGILIASTIMTGNAIAVKYWFIFLTHWGILFIAATAGLGFVVSVIVFLQGPIDATFGLPWYVKAYWVTYNFTIPIAFFITLFYWVLLRRVEEDFAINKTLDIFIHGINSVLMLVLVVTSSHPSRLLHFHHSLITGVVYLLFSVIYYFAGGLGPTGDNYIYPMLNWSNPAVASVTCVGSALMIFLMHCIVVALSAVRTNVTKRCTDPSNSLSISNDRYN